MEKNLNQLPDPVAKEYKLKKGFPFKFVHLKYGSINLNNINLKQAESLAKDANIGLVKIASKKEDK